MEWELRTFESISWHCSFACLLVSEATGQFRYKQAKTGDNIHVVMQMTVNPSGKSLAVAAYGPVD